ncbi:hypothetical protein ACIGXM_07965 [Kitasatospora sp. NPDC052896]|uniref:hypothetical protein n=1 Tax=Kitasatospora sp. NPDC052896 TaxID=3364061 RepID=UPI0037C7F8D9
MPAKKKPRSKQRTTERRRKRCWKTATVVLLVALFGLAYCADDLAYELRLAGTPGTFRAVGCQSAGSGRGSGTTCAGEFRSDDGKVDDPNLSIDRAVPVLRPVPMQLDAPDDLHEVGADTIAYSLALLLLVVAVGAYAVALVTEPPKRKVVSRGERIAGQVITSSVLGSVLVATAGVVISAWS